MNDPFVTRVRVVVWALVVLALTGYALYAFAAGLPWPKAVIPGVLALLTAAAGAQRRTL